jgi:hypothetical protein
MALLDPVHWEVITPQMRDLLRFIGQQPFAGRFYLAGGTALALRLGHRRSIDLDFFSTTDQVLRDTRQEILRALALLSPQALEDVDGNLLLFENADQDPQPDLLIDLPWAQVRQFFIAQAQTLGQAWFGKREQ